MWKVILFLMLLATGPGLFADGVLLEYQVKAVCVLNTMRFVSWPETAFSSAESPLVIGVLGENPFGPALGDVVQGETLQHRRVVVRRVNLSEASSVQVLFISNSERDRLEGIMRALGNASVLTISEIKRFTQSGGMIGLALGSEKIRFEIDPDTCRRAQLKVNPQFLLMARRAK